LPNDPRSFASLTHPTLIYGVGESTPTGAREWVGPGVGSDSGMFDFWDEIVNFTTNFDRNPRPNERWYDDVLTYNDGDTTVPLESLQFGLTDTRLAHRPFRNGNNPTDGVKHPEIPSNVDAQKLMLNVLGAPLAQGNISTDLLNGKFSALTSS